MKKFGSFILGNWIWLTIAIVIISIAAVFCVPDLRIEEDESTWFSSQDPILKVYHEFQEVFVTNETAVIAYSSGDPLSGKELKYLSRLCKKLEKIPNIIDVISLTTVNDIKGTEEGLEIKPLVKRKDFSNTTNPQLQERIVSNPFLRSILFSEEYGTLGIVLQFEWTDENKKEAGDLSRKVTTALREILQKESEEHGRRFYLGGNIITDAEVSSMVERDMFRFFPASLILAAIVLLIVFRDITSIFFPILSVSIALLWTLGLKGIFGSPITPVSTTLFALITVIGIANSVHLISHFNIAIRRIDDKREALLETFERAGSACFFTSITTAFGFGSLSISRLPVIRDMGLFSAFGIMSAFCISIILVTTGMLFKKVDKEKLKKQYILAPKSLLLAIININLKYPLLILAIGAGIIVIMILGIPKIEVESSMLEYLKKGCPLRKDAEFIDSALVGISSVEVVIKGEEDSFKEPDNLKKIEKLQNLVMKHPEVSVSHSMADYLKLIFRSLNSDSSQYYRIPETRAAVAQSLLLYEMSGGSDIEDFVTTNYEEARVSISTRQMTQNERSALLEDIGLFMKSNFSDMKYEVTGFDNLVFHTTKRIVTTQIKSITLAATIIMLLMTFIFGLKGGLVSIIPNIFPIVFLLGLMGYAGFRLDIATAIIASIAIGIVVDDTIHYFSHYKYELKAAGNREQAMINAHMSVGSALCYTTIILALGFLIFLLSETRILFHYGLLSCIAVTIALLGDLFIGPVLLVKLKVFKKNSGAGSREK